MSSHRSTDVTPQMSSLPSPDVLFLGLAERAAYVRDGSTNLFKWNVLGLKHIILSHIFPLPLSGYKFGFAFSAVALKHGGDHKFRLVSEAGEEAGSINLSPSTASPNDPEAALGRESPSMLVPSVGWTTAFLPVGLPNIVIKAPGIYEVRYVSPQGEVVVGQLHFVVIPPPPLSEERIAAIRSDPTAMKAVRIEFGCNSCSSKFRTYAALERSPQSESEGWTWYQELQDMFVCSCGKTNMPLEYYRKNLHGLLGSRQLGIERVNFVPLYERSSLETTRLAFTALLQSKPNEELLQRFLEENPILFHQFAPLRLFMKPPILTFFVADFAFLTPHKELVLVEIEKGNTRLMKKDGGIAAPLSHAFDQVRNWLHVVDEHRLAVLDTLKIEKEDVGSIRSLVIAGRDVGYDALHLRKLKSEDRGRVMLFTYDDLLFGLSALIGRIGEL